MKPLTGLDYYVSRYYDPVAGVFLSADTKEGNAQGMNPYAYVAQNPETLTDPSGQMIVFDNPLPDFVGVNGITPTRLRLRPRRPGLLRSVRSDGRRHAGCRPAACRREDTRGVRPC